MNALTILIVIVILLLLTWLGVFLYVYITHRKKSDMYAKLSQKYMLARLSPQECKQEKDDCLDYQKRNCSAVTDKGDNSNPCNTAICDEVEKVCLQPERKTGWG